MKSTAPIFERLESIASQYASNGLEADTHDQFSLENYKLLKENKFFLRWFPKSWEEGARASRKCVNYWREWLLSTLQQHSLFPCTSIL
ncbi:hypothetical protein BIT28_09475 [Photobacterium proteolyticum]|uniref:Uncharacterized protein n=1 Tax=Photobacterium proteolyticum TaxID=1903952 RepID=A0A1Q9H1I9_9GAMM|nr:hypothetical protein BIT28_09475 [Photobacterium proteolyticum]